MRVQFGGGMELRKVKRGIVVGREGWRRVSRGGVRLGGRFGWVGKGGTGRGRGAGEGV